jgi:hypothetical protein
MMTEITNGLNSVRRHEERRKNATNMNQTTEVFQGPDESPRQFYEQLCETFCIYTPFDPEAAENGRMINTTFIS